MLAQSRRHAGSGFEQTRKYPAVRGQDRILLVENIKSSGAVVSVDYYFYAVAHVVDGIFAQLVMGGVRILIGGGESIHHPREPAVLADYQVRIRIVSKEGRQGGYPIAHVAPHQQPALRIDIVAERQFSQIAAIKRQHYTAQQAAHYDTAVPLIRSEIIALALGIVEFLLARLDVNVGVRQLAIVNFRTSYV